MKTLVVVRHGMDEPDLLLFLWGFLGNWDLGAPFPFVVYEGKGEWWFVWLSLPISIENVLPEAAERFVEAKEKFVTHKLISLGAKRAAAGCGANHYIVSHVVMGAVVGCIIFTQKWYRSCINVLAPT